MKLIILGAPGSGKGTTATVLREKYSLAHISTGDIFRANIKNGTPLGLEAKSYIDSGALVPDSVTIRMVEDRLSQDDTKNGSSIDAVLSIVVDDEIIKDRVSSRRVCEKCGASYNVRFKPTKVEGVCDECGGKVIQRADDVPETVAARLETYYKNTKPLIDFYEGRGLIVEGDNGKSSEDCLKQIEEGLKVKGLI